jgi:hypothetical protein
MDIFFPSLSVVDPATAGLNEGKKTPREGSLYPAPDSDLFLSHRVLRESLPSVKEKRALAVYRKELDYEWVVKNRFWIIR